MHQVTHVLTGSDLGGASAAVVERAVRIARGCGARLTVLHALELDTPAVIRSFFGEDAEELTRRAMQGVTRHLTESVERIDHGGVDTGVVLEPGQSAASLAGYARENGVDLIVIGARDSGLMQRMFFGSTASRLLRTAPCPILVARRPGDEPYSEVLVAVDFSPASEESIRLVRAIAPDAHLHLLHVATLPLQAQMRYAGVEESAIASYRRTARERAMVSLMDLASNAGLRPEQYAASVTTGDPAAEILDHIEATGCTLVALGKHGTHRVVELLMGSVTRKIVTASDCDTVVITDPVTGPVLSPVAQA